MLTEEQTDTKEFMLSLVLLLMAMLHLIAMHYTNQTNDMSVVYSIVYPLMGLDAIVFPIVLWVLHMIKTVGYHE
jgi:hypothetical protein